MGAGESHSKNQHTLNVKNSEAYVPDTPTRKAEGDDLQNFTPKQNPFDPRSPNVNEPRTPFLQTQDRSAVGADLAMPK